MYKEGRDHPSAHADLAREPTSPSLAGEFFTTESPGKPPGSNIKDQITRQP